MSYSGAVLAHRVLAGYSPLAMSPAVEQLVRETMELTGAREPALMEEDAPVLAEDALASGEESFYLVGLIGGKDVGKSALVNALAGRNITETSSYGPGTEAAIAYAHVSQAGPLRDLLDQVVPGQYRIVTHELPELRRQVLLDLPDIDSHFASHLQVTRATLRHMLFPVWVGSVEKYADRQPQQMLAKVAAGNAPNNFLFCLNKMDQLGSSGLGGLSSGSGSATELREDYAGRIQRTLKLEGPPRVYSISATHPDAFDLPALRQALSRERTPQGVRQSQELAGRRQDQSLLTWLDRQQLPLRAQRLAQLQEDAEELAAQRIGGPLLDQLIPRLMNDPATRGALVEEILTERVAHWPIVRLVHTLLSPLFTLMRGAMSRTAAPMESTGGMVEIALRESGYSVSDLVQTTFAQLRQAQPAMSEIYAQRRLWEQMPADLSAGELRRALAATIQRQRDAARERFTGSTWVWAPFRWLLTVGAIFWFPFVQPILFALLGGYDASHWKDRMKLVVGVLSTDDLLRSAAFLILYFIALWLALRWNTQHRVTRLTRRWKAAEACDPVLDLAGQVIEWLDGLTAPIRQARDRMESAAQRAESLRRSVDRAA